MKETDIIGGLIVLQQYWEQRERCWWRCTVCGAMWEDYTLPPTLHVCKLTEEKGEEMGNTERVHFSKLSREQVDEFIDHMKNAAVEHAEKIHMSGLSDLSAHNIYAGIEDMMYAEWDKSKKAMGVK